MPPPDSVLDWPDDDLMAEVEAGLAELDTIDDARRARVWNAIAAAAFEDDEDDDAHDSAHEGPTATEPASTRTADVIDLASRRPSTVLGWVVTAAAAIAIVAAGLGTLGQDPAVPVATFAMDALDDRAEAPVDGEIVQRTDATVVELDLTGLDQRTDDSHYELWFLDLDAGQIVSLGTVDPTTTTVAVPADLDPEAFPLLDVSVEPNDGDESHSGDSVLRGPITGI